MGIRFASGCICTERSDRVTFGSLLRAKACYRGSQGLLARIARFYPEAMGTFFHSRNSDPAYLHRAAVAVERMPISRSDRYLDFAVWVCEFQPRWTKAGSIDPVCEELQVSQVGLKATREQARGFGHPPARPRDALNLASVDLGMPPARSLNRCGSLRNQVLRFVLLVLLAPQLGGCCLGMSAMLGNTLLPKAEMLPGWLSVTLYHPEQGLHEATVVDMGAPNLVDTKVQIVCIPDEDLNTSEAKALCQNVAKMLRQQGAETEILIPSDKKSTAFPKNAAPDLRVEIQSATLHSHFDEWACALSTCSCTLTPMKMEHAYSHLIRVRGKNGSLLSENRMQSRFVQYTGCGVGSINSMLDYFFRDDDQKLGGKAAYQDFSRDFYRQISQLTFNAKMRSEVLGLTPRKKFVPRQSSAETMGQKQTAETLPASSEEKRVTPPPVAPASDGVIPPLERNETNSDVANPPVENTTTPKTEPSEAPKTDPEDESAAHHPVGAPLPSLPELATTQARGALPY